MRRISIYDIIRNDYEMVSRIYENATLDYNGAPGPDEDPADYLPRGGVIQAVRIA
ncbi:hypothetical protein G3578_09840 [Brevibacillus sp. SYP-B805]|uniref:hypothetical protein n=1 Tax=Brevibacillus sp. SYP-B805 TaxID=1578199 RepID=UPI0013EB2ECD|nr:hypothetical protein [Brevibacillus sp. SYP-B805]NGQ95454.1 hypothetical protein [Brevibacillus sp. SYP-B805]